LFLGPNQALLIIRLCLQGLAEVIGFSLDTPVKDLTAEQWQAFVYGSDVPITFSYYNAFDEFRRWKAPFEGFSSLF
jgi:excinuclease ABC subunit A